jgi:phage baseplate assembly protein V
MSFEALGRRVMAMFTRGVVEAVDDAPQFQELQVSLHADEAIDSIEHIHPYGFTSCPLPGAEAVVAAVGGLRAHSVVILVGDRRYRLLNLAPGECAIHDDLGQKVHLTRDGILIESSLRIDVSAPEVKVSADTATIEADTVNLGGVGGPAVARVGDTVAGGVITSGSSKVRAS